MYTIHFGLESLHFSDEVVFRSFCRNFCEVEAAGGLVRDEKGCALMIRRNGLWDLPKGHRERGEEMLSTALREVEEETGVRADRDPEPRFLCITHHAFCRGGRWYLKHTSWYAMRALRTETRPQREEDITEAVWVTASEVESCLNHAYSSIPEVFRAENLQGK